LTIVTHLSGIFSLFTIFPPLFNDANDGAFEPRVVADSVFEMNDTFELELSKGSYGGRFMKAGVVGVGGISSPLSELVVL
jgi:hypothetical protein